MLVPKGSIVPLPTPFHGPDAAIDEAALARLVEFQIDHGSHGLSCTGTTGEPSSLSLSERKRVIDLVHEIIGGRVPFVPGTGTNNIDETLELTRYAALRGVDGVLVIAPYYVRPNQNNLFAYFKTVADAVPETPVILYNIPGRTAVNIEPATIGRLREACPNLVGVKHATKNLDDVSYTFVHAGRDFAVYCGAETLTYPMLTLGGSGHISATGRAGSTRDRATLRAGRRRQVGRSARPALPDARAQRRPVHRDQSGPSQDGAVADGADRSALAPAAGPHASGERDPPPGHAPALRARRGGGVGVRHARVIADGRLEHARVEVDAAG